MDYTVDAVDKAVGLLFLVAQQPGLGVTELAKRSGNTKARAFRLLGTLEQSGLLQREGESSNYSLGYKALFLGAAAQEQLSLVRMAKKHLLDIGVRSNENVMIRVRDGLESVCIAWQDSTHAVRIHTEIGDRKPLYAGASGKLLLAFAPPEIQAAVLDGDLQQFTPNTIVDRTNLEQELAKIKADAYSVSFAERTSEATAVAAPIRDARGDVIASFSIAGPTNRMSKESIPAFIDLAKMGARNFSIELGYAAY